MKKTSLIFLVLALALSGASTAFAGDTPRHTMFAKDAAMSHPASSADTTAFERLLARNENVLRRIKAPTGTNASLPPGVGPALHPAIDSALPGFVQVNTVTEFSHVLSFNATFWVTKTIPANTVYAKRTVYNDQSVRVSPARQLDFELDPGTGVSLGGVNSEDSFEFPVAVQILIPDFTAQTFTVVSGEVRSDMNPGNYQANSIGWDSDGTRSFLALTGTFESGAPIAVMLNGMKIAPAAIQVSPSLIVIHPELDPYLQSVSFFVGTTPDIVVEQYGSCTTTKLPLVILNQKG